MIRKFAVVALSAFAVAAATAVVIASRPEPPSKAAVGQQSHPGSRRTLFSAGISDEATMVVVGGALIGLARAVRRAA